MTIIAVDTALEIFSAGLSTGKNKKDMSGIILPEQRYYLTINSGQKHSESIMDAIDTLLRMAGVARTELEAVACMEGPGSFTGLRIGFAAAKGLALALGIPIISVPTLDCMAFSFWPGMVLPVLDAKKKMFFSAIYWRGKRISGYLDTGMDALLKTIADAWQSIDFLPAEKKPALPPLLVVGPAVDIVMPGLVSVFPDTVSDYSWKRGYVFELLNLAKERCILNQDLDYYAAGPMYLRKSDAELNKKTDT